MLVDDKIFREHYLFQAVYIAPLKALVRERMDDWKVRIEQKLGKKWVHCHAFLKMIISDE